MNGEWNASEMEICAGAEQTVKLHVYNEVKV